MNEQLPDLDVRPGAKRLADALVQAGAWPPTTRAARRRLERLVRKAEKRTKARAA